MKYSVVIIGLGNIAQGYDFNLTGDKIYTHGKAFFSHQSFTIVAGVDSVSDKCLAFSEKYNCKTYTEIKDALRIHQPDIVVIAVPTEFHYSVIQDVLRTHIPRIILCEKPLAYLQEDARAIVEICLQVKVQLYVNYIRRSMPGVIKVKDKFLNLLTEQVKGNVWYSKGLMHNGSHLINLLEYWLGAAKSFQIITSGRKIILSKKVEDYEPDFLVQFQKGRVIFQASWEEKFSHYTIELLTSDGRLRYDNGGKDIYWQQTTKGNNNLELSNEIEKIPSGFDHYQLHVADQLAKALSGKNNFLCSGEEALKTLEFIDSIIKEL